MATVTIISIIILMWELFSRRHLRLCRALTALRSKTWCIPYQIVGWQRGEEFRSSCNASRRWWMGATTSFVWRKRDFIHFPTSSGSDHQMNNRILVRLRWGNINVIEHTTDSLQHHRGLRLVTLRPRLHTLGTTTRTTATHIMARCLMY